MRNTWKVLTVAALILVGCKGDKTDSGPRSTQAGKSGEATRPGAGGEPTYTINMTFRPAVGKTVAVHQTEKKSGFMKTIQGKEWREEKMDESRESQFLETLLEAGDRLPRKFKRHYEKASRTTMGQTTALIYEGKTIVFELAGGQYKATAEGGGLGALPLGLLAQDVSEELHLEEALVPGKPVKLHESWTIPPRKLEEVFGKMGGIDLGKSRGEAKLARVYREEGSQFGVIEFEITLAVNQMQNSRLDPPLTRTWTGSTDAAIDGSSTALNTSRTSKLKGKSLMEGPDKKKLGLEAALEITGRREQSFERPGSK